LAHLNDQIICRSVYCETVLAHIYEKLAWIRRAGWP
jgi:hypothetical protein